MAEADGHVTHAQRYDEIVAAVIAVQRQRQIPRLTDEAVRSGCLMLDPASRKVYVDRAGTQTILAVGPAEFRLLYFLMTHADRIFTPDQLQQEVWGEHAFSSDRTVRTYVTRLRTSLRAGNCDSMLETVHRVGYRFTSTGTARPASTQASSEKVPLNSVSPLRACPLASSDERSPVSSELN